MLRRAVTLILNHPYLTISFWLLFAYTGQQVLQIDRGSMGDFDIYMNVAQVLNHGGRLYDTAVDIKNMGFFLVFSSLYNFYTLFFSNIEYFHLFQAGFLFLMYFGMLSLIYCMITKLWDSRYGLMISFLSFCFLTAVHYTYFLNQVQLALFVYIVLINFILNTIQKAQKRYFFVYGILLGVCFSVASPYLLLTLIIPILAFYQFQQDKQFTSLILKCVVAFLGFVVSLIPFIIYFSQNFQQWFFWNIEFSTMIYSGNTSIWTKLFTAVDSFLFNRAFFAIRGEKFLHYNFIRFVVISWLGILGYRFISKNKFALTSPKVVLVLICLISLLPRLLLTSGWTSYNLYVLPALILLLPILYDYVKQINTKYAQIGFMILLAWGGLCMANTARFYVRHTKAPRNLELQEFTQNNPDKSPSIMMQNANGYVYSTHWVQPFFSVYGLWYGIDKDRQTQFIMSTKPEILVGFDETKTQYSLEFQQFLDFEYQKNSENSTISIRKDKFSTWNFGTNIIKN